MTYNVTSWKKMFCVTEGNIVIAELRTESQAQSLAASLNDQAK